jgi:ERCC4 domain
MAEGRPGPVFRVVADHREFGSGVPEALRLRQDAVVVAGALASGDYVINEIVGIERKTGNDFARSVFDGRLFRQVSALTRRYERPLLLLEGLVPGQETSGVSWAALRGAIISVTAVFGVPIVCSSNSEESAEVIATVSRQISAVVQDDGYARPGYRPKGQQPVEKWMRASWPAFCKSQRPTFSPQLAWLLLESPRAKSRPPQGVAAARGRLRRRPSSPMRRGIALVAPPCIRPRGARNAAPHPLSTGC